MTRAFSGRDVEEVTLDAIRSQEIDVGDVRISAEQLHVQADVAAAHSNPQLAANFRRAAELTAIADEEVMAIYEALRPGRSSFDELVAMADGLESRGATLNAELVREAAHVYRQRGILPR